MDVQTVLDSKKKFSGKCPGCEKCAFADRPFLPSQVGTSKVIVIGGTPGHEDITKGFPFSSMSGSLLRRKLGDVGFNVNEVTFMYAVKCRPPLDPVTKEQVKVTRKVIKLCSKLFLDKELEELKDNKITILAGQIATSVFFSKVKKMTSVVGEFKKHEDRRCYPIYSPSVILRSQSMAQQYTKDLNRARQYVDGSLYKHKQYTLLENEQAVTEAVNILVKQEVVAFDIETPMTLDPFDPNMAINTISFCYERNKAFCIPLDHRDVESVRFREHCWKEVKRFMESDAGKIAHNATFDVKILQYFGVRTNNLVGDTLVFAFLLNENRYSNGLKTLAQELLDGCCYEWSENLEELSNYNCEDTDNCLALYQKFLPELKKHVRMKKVFDEILVPLIYIIVDMELKGVSIDKEFAKKLEIELEEQLEALNEGLLEDVPQAKGVNMGSPLQLRKLMFEKLRYPSRKKTEKGGLPSTDASVLEQLSYEGYVLPKYMTKIRKTSKLLSTYVRKMPLGVASDGRLHGGFNICGARTGRLSSSKPNLQNIPRDKRVKRMFVPKEGTILLNADASQAELRVGCSIAREQRMIAAYKEGQDIHKLTASKILKKSIDAVTKEDRQKAKAVNFGFLYGQSAEGFQKSAESDYGLHLSMEECTDFRNAFFAAYPGFLGWYGRTKMDVMSRGFVEYPTGRRRRFPEARQTRGDLAGEIFRQAVNSPVQGSASDIVLFMIVAVDRYIKGNKVPADIIITVHDSIVLECADGSEELIVDEIERIWKHDIPDYFRWLAVPMPFDYSIGLNWGDMREM